jgi:hypothetical protein
MPTASGVTGITIENMIEAIPGNINFLPIGPVWMISDTR